MTICIEVSIDKKVTLWYNDKINYHIKVTKMKYKNEIAFNFLKKPRKYLHCEGFLKK